MPPSPAARRTAAPTRSYAENADGYVLTTSLMKWFWDHYADPASRTDPKASPLRARDLCLALEIANGQAA